MTERKAGLILVRTRQLDEHVAAFADELREASGLDVQYIVDERHLATPSSDPDIVSLNAASYRKLGLFVPHDVAWRCGDYGLYMAWQARPDYAFYWVIEDDVRIAGDAADFFRSCAAIGEFDLLATNLRPADRSSYWYPHSVSSDATPYRCLFGIIRMSNTCVTHAFAKRRAQSAQFNRLALWPNDEALVATTAVQAGLRTMDFKSLDSSLYDDATFSVTAEPRIDVPRSGPARMLHPVRFVERPTQRSRKANWDDAEKLPFRIRTAVIRRINQRFAW